MAEFTGVERRVTEYITSGEFTRAMAFLEEIRADLKAGQANLQRELVDVGKRITDRQDLSNGRLAKAEGDIIATIRDLRVLEVKAAAYRDARSEERVNEQAMVAEIKRELETLMTEGCRVRAEHAAEVTALQQAGVLTQELEGPRGWRRAAPAVGFSLSGMGLGLLAPHLGEILHWLVSFLPGVKP